MKTAEFLRFKGDRETERVVWETKRPKKRSASLGKIAFGPR